MRSHSDDASDIHLRGPGPDLDGWTEERIILSNLELIFYAPKGESRFTPGISFSRNVDLDREISSASPAIAVYSHMWDFDESWWKGVMGNLGVGIAVRRQPDDSAADLTSLDSLQQVVQRDLDQAYSAENERLRREGKEQFIVKPLGYKRINIRGRDWLVYSLGGEFDRTDYVTPLSPKYYLRVGFDFVDNSRGYKSNWRQQAQSVAEKMAASLEIRKNTSK